MTEIPMRTAKPYTLPDRPILFAIFLVAVAALVLPIGTYPVTLLTDEPIRLMVSTEMIISGDYLSPTLNGDPYFNKPPLYNWVIIASFKLFGSESMFAYRFPMILSWFILGLLVYGFTRKHTGDKNFALLAGLLAVTHGRLVFYDTLLGLIDLCYAALTYLVFMVVYTYGRKNDWTRLFLYGYALTAVGQLMKGITSPVFLGLTLLAYFLVIRRDQWRRLFSIQHVMGVILFAGILLAYYIPYFDRNDFHPRSYFETMLANNAKGTPINFSIWKTIRHILFYPFHMLYDYAPWMLLSLMLIRKDMLRRLREHPYIFFNAVIFLANFIVYWASPETFARYLFMLLPLLFTTGLYFYTQVADTSAWQRKVVDGFLWWSMVLVTIALPSVLFIPKLDNIPDRAVKMIALLVTMAALLWSVRARQTSLIFAYAIALLVLRIGFNWFVLPQRGSNDRKVVAHAKHITQLTGDKPVYIYGENFHYQHSPIHSKNGMSYLLAKEKRQYVRITKNIDTSGYYLAFAHRADSLGGQRVYTFWNNRGDQDSLVLFRFPRRAE
jgi:4-amino-4-deoxy-L-arabinose transferase-like glycosyltransferase